jgi:acetyl-CoA C-acetyltransferase
MFVTGAGKTKFGILSKSLMQLAYEAVSKALEDAEIPAREIGAVYVANFLGGSLNSQLHMNSVLSGLFPGMHMPIIRVETACASGGSAIYQALMSLQRFENVLVVGVEKMTCADPREAAKSIAMAGDRVLDQNEGLLFPAAYALIAQSHMMRHATTLDDLALISLKNHANANLNSLAHFYQTKVDIDAIRSSPVVAAPLRLFDCSPVSDGAAAVVLSRKNLNGRGVKVVASSMATDTISISQRLDITSFKAARIAAANAYKEACLTPEKIDVAQVHDCFTIAELIAMEDLGFCKPGEGKDYIRTGKTQIGGELPINVDGGLKACGHPIGATGVSQVCEITVQLRGEAGNRQVDGARTGLVHNIGGAGGTCVVHILRSDKV